MKTFFKAIAIIGFIATVSTAQTISANGSTKITANEAGNLGVLYPLLNGKAATAQERGQFVYQIKTNAQFISLDNVFKFVNGYDDTSPDNQYGFWDNGGDNAGIWLRPVTSDCRLQIHFGQNFVEYELVGNPNAPRPNPNTPGATIAIATPNNPDINGWDLVWSDEFNGNSLDKNKWNIDIGVGQQGWGNQERQYYTDNAENLFVADGKLIFKSSKQVRTTNGWESRFNSGKVTSSNKYSWKYGRIDFLVKLPLGQGYWPALWMMPQKSVYGGWALSGEIDVMEAKGRLPNGSSGALHFGGAWCQQPCDGNTYLHGDYSFPAGVSIDKFNVYTLIWETNRLSWYVNGNRFLTVTNDRWYTKTAPDNPLAPFDQEFFIIMNLAIGGHFDNFLEPSDAELGRTMEIDYVRVYKPGSSNVNRTISVTHNGNGTVKNGDTEINSGSPFEVQSGANVTLTLTPGSGYEVTDIKIDGQSITPENSIALGSVTSNQTVEVTFAKRINVPGAFNATAYSKKSSEIVATTDDNGTYVGYLINNSTLEYLINVNQAGAYKFSAKIATEGDGRQISIYNGNSTTALATLPVEKTSNWYAWSTANANITLPAGDMTLRLVANGAVNIEDITVVSLGATSTAGKNDLRKIAFAFAGIHNGQINLNLKQGNYTVELYDLKGRLIDKIDVNAINGLNATGLKTDKLSIGVYFLNVKTGESSVLKHKMLVK